MRIRSIRCVTGGIGHSVISAKREFVNGRKQRSVSLADHIFIDMCRDILENGTSTEGEKVRPHWEDKTAAYTVKKFGVETAMICPGNFRF